MGPKVTPATFAEAEKLVQIEMSPADRAQAAGNWREAMAPLYERRTGPRKMDLEAGLAPATVWNPMLPGLMPGKSGRGDNYYIRSADPRTPLPANDADIALCLGCAAFALDSIAADHFGAADADLP